MEPKNRPRTKTDSKLSGQEPSAVDKRSTKACKSPQQKDFSSRKTSEVSSSKTERSFSEYKVNTSTSSFSRDKHSSLGAQVPVDNTSYDILGDLMGFTPKNVSSNIPKESSYSKKESPKRELPSPGVEDNSSSVLSQLMDTTKQSEQSNNKKRKLEDSPEKEISPPKKKVLSDDESCRASDTLPKKVCPLHCFLFSSSSSYVFQKKKTTLRKFNFDVFKIYLILTKFFMFSFLKIIIHKC